MADAGRLSLKLKNRKGRKMDIKTIRMKIEGMTCNHCEGTVAKAIQGKGIIEKSVSYKNGSAQVSYDAGAVGPEDIIHLVNETVHYKVAEYSIRIKQT